VLFQSDAFYPHIIGFIWQIIRRGALFLQFRRGYSRIHAHSRGAPHPLAGVHIEQLHLIRLESDQKVRQSDEFLTRSAWMHRKNERA
jgi:hypothetical protein